VVNLDEIILDQESKNNFQSLCELYKKNAPLIIFFGAGLGRTPGLPTWKELLVELCMDVGLRYDDIEGEYWDKASSIEDACNVNGRDFNRDIKSHLRPINSYISGVLHSLISTNFNAFITTNFDNIFSRLVLRQKLKLKEQFYPDFNPSRLINREIIYLHGNIEHSNNIIFTSRQYTTAYSNNYGNLMDIIESAYWYNSIVFLGFSFDDKYFSDLYIDIQKNRKQYFGNMRRKAPSDFVFFSAPYLDNNKVDLKSLEEKKLMFKSKYHLMPVSFCLYRNGYVYLEDLMDILTGVIPTKTISDKGDEL